MKTKKYTIQFDMLENDLSTEIEISKKEYETQLAFLTAQVDNTKTDDAPVQNLYGGSKVIEYRQLTLTKHVFTCGCATTYLKFYNCKKGFHFSK